jgi:hypothetical protein
VLALLAVVPLGMLLVKAPFVSAGVLFGSLLLAAAFVHPLALLGVMFIIGPIDLSFMTGGFKSLFASVGGLDMNGIRLIGVAGGLGYHGCAAAAGTACAARPVRYRVRRVPGLCRIHIPGSASPVDGMRLWLKLAYPLLIFAVVAGVATRREHVDRLLDCALVGAALVAVLSLLLTLSGRYGVYDDGLVRVRGVTLTREPVLVLSADRHLHGVCALRRSWPVALSAAVGCARRVARADTDAHYVPRRCVGMLGIALYAAIAARNTRVLIGAAVIGLLIAVPLTPIVLERSLGFVPTPAELMALLQLADGAVRVDQLAGAGAGLADRVRVVPD